jgi:hypothetical protein
MAGKKSTKKPAPRKWSGKVTRESNALDLEPGVFTWSDSKKIARSLKRSAEASDRRKGTAYQSAVSMLNFYINRAGRNLSPKRRGVLEEAKTELKKIFKNNRLKGKSAGSSERLPSSGRADRIRLSAYISKYIAKNILVVLSLAILAASGIYFAASGKFRAYPAPTPYADINSFEECATAGYPVMESYPERCMTPDGRTFTRQLDGSGLPEDDELMIPTATGQSRKINLYYYNMELDRDEEGNILCSRKGLAPVEREIPLTISPVRDAINLLLKGELTREEEARNIVTEYPLEGLALKNAVLKDGVLTLTFDDPLNKTSGGACRVGILWFQIEATAKQFPEVKEVKFLPEELFQP